MQYYMVLVFFLNIFEDVCARRGTFIIQIFFDFGAVLASFQKKEEKKKEKKNKTFLPVLADEFFRFFFCSPQDFFLVKNTVVCQLRGLTGPTRFGPSFH